MLSRLLKRNEGQGHVLQLLACLNTTPGSINPTVSKVHFLAVVNVTSHYEATPDRPSCELGEEGGGSWDQAPELAGVVSFSESIKT